MNNKFQHLLHLVWRGNIGLSENTKQHISRMHFYCKSKHAPEIFQRTYPHRFDEQIEFLKSAFNPRTRIGKKDFTTFCKLSSVLFPAGHSAPLFFDVGPGIANIDPVILKGNGKPAVTSQEVAVAFPDFNVVVLDLPDAVDKFTGASHGNGYTISKHARLEFLAHRNIHIIAGDGLKSLLEQWKDQQTNPFRQRTRPALTENSPIIIRISNSLDIYCPELIVWMAIKKMFSDFFENPVLLFFNRFILIKHARSKIAFEIGKVSARGFNHNARPVYPNSAIPFLILKNNF